MCGGIRPSDGSPSGVDPSAKAVQSVTETGGSGTKGGQPTRRLLGTEPSVPATQALDC